MGELGELSYKAVVAAPVLVVQGFVVTGLFAALSACSSSRFLIQLCIWTHQIRPCWKFVSCVELDAGCQSEE